MIAMTCLGSYTRDAHQTSAGVPGNQGSLRVVRSRRQEPQSQRRTREATARAGIAMQPECVKCVRGMFFTRASG
jgi:hypothetical protein